MLPQDQLQIIRSRAQEFDVQKVWLFGSSLVNPDTARDVDLAVEGIDPDRFFDFYCRLFWDLTKPVDVVDMDSDVPIRHLVRKRGVVIYER